MVHQARASHIGTCLSAADLMAVLYSQVLRVDPCRPDWPERDRFILSKGHGAAIMYAALAERGFFASQLLDTYCQDGSPLGGHITCHNVPGVEVSTGSLGHGLSIGCGMALAGKRDGLPHRVFVMLSDGELNEGSIWEAVMFAAHHGLDHLVAIIDYNKWQAFGPVKEVLNLEPLAEKWRVFGWSVKEVDGHDCRDITETLSHIPFEPGKPGCLIAHTVKGKGVSFMESQLAWHYRSPSAEDLAKALEELENNG